MRYFLYPLSFLYGFAVELRNLLFHVGILKEMKMQAKVISVGNLTMGGTGKSPIVATLVDYCTKHNISVGVVTRGYGSGIKKASEVTEPNPQKFGDEPSWLKQRFPKVPIYISPNRVVAAQSLVEKFNPQVIVADDAFQHRYLGRDINIVVLDATEPKKNYHLLPTGRLRESFCQIKRADYVFLSKANLAQDSQLNWLRQKANNKIIEWEYLPQSLINIKGEKFPLKTLEDKHIFLVSGIGRPQTFEGLVKKYSKNIKGHLKFRDHHCYTKMDIEEIKRQSKEALIITTEKDFIKFRNYSLPALALQMEAYPKEPLDVLFS